MHVGTIQLVIESSFFSAFFWESQFNNNRRAAIFLSIIRMYSTVELCVTVYYIIMINTIFFN